LPNRFQNCSSPIQKGLCYLSRPEMVGLCRLPINKCSVHEGKYMLAGDG
jgi:hypothetical protein